MNLDRLFHLKTKLVRFIYYFFITIYITFVISGCASFPSSSHTASDDEDVPVPVNLENSPKLYLDVKYYYGQPEKWLCVEKKNKTSALKEIIENIIENKKLFKNYTMHSDNSNDSDYIIKMNFYQFIPDGYRGITIIADSITCFSFGIIPTKTSKEFFLKAEIINKNGSIAKTSSKNGIVTWRSLLLVIFYNEKRDPNVISRKIFENMVKESFQKLYKQRPNIFG